MKYLLLLLPIAALAQTPPPVPTNLRIASPATGGSPFNVTVVTNDGVRTLIANYSWPVEPTNAVWVPHWSINGVDWVPIYSEWCQLPDRVGRAASIGREFPRRAEVIANNTNTVMQLRRIN
jgi:hypothetical protein